jgi:predicted deacetylase
LNGRIPKEPREEFKRTGLSGLKAKLKEKADQLIPDGWPEKAVVPPEVLKRKS